MSRRSGNNMHQARSRAQAVRPRSGRRRLLDHARAAAAVQPFEALESRTLLTIVQPAAQDYLAFEAEDPQATFTDLDGDGFQWSVISGAATVGTNTLPSGGAAIQAHRDASGGTTNNEGQVSYPIQLTSAGPYFFYARTKYTASGGDNSMYLPDGRTAGPIDADPTQQWDNRTDAVGDYHWNNLDVNGASFTYTNPTPGAPTTLKMNIRENGYIVDKIVLSTTAKTPAQLDALLGQSAVAVPGPQPGQVTVRFTPVTGATSYNIFRSTSATTGFTQIGTAAGGLTSFIDQTLPAGSAGQTFYYTVQPVTASGPGAQTSPAAAVVINNGARVSYFNDAFWGSGGRASTRRTLETFRAGPYPDLQTIVPTVDNSWGSGSPDPAIRPDNFSTIYSGIGGDIGTTAA